MRDISNEALNFIKDFFKKDYSGHDYYHTFRVYKTAMKISEKEDCDVNKVKIIALLHDVDDHKISPKTCKNLDNARTFLKSNNIDEDIINSICSDIKNISFSKRVNSSVLSIEAKIVQDADRLDAIGAIGIARTFAFGGAHNRAIYDIENKENSTIQHFYDKLLILEDLINTKYAKKLAKERTEFLKTFLNQFYKELL
jgi:uncharacterized protein